MKNHRLAFVVFFLFCVVGGFVLMIAPLLGAAIVIIAILVYTRFRLRIVKNERLVRRVK